MVGGLSRVGTTIELISKPRTSTWCTRSIATQPIAAPMGILTCRENPFSGSSIEARKLSHLLSPIRCFSVLASIAASHKLSSNFGDDASTASARLIPHAHIVRIPTKPLHPEVGLPPNIPVKLVKVTSVLGRTGTLTLLSLTLPNALLVPLLPPPLLPRSPEADVVSKALEEVSTGPCRVHDHP